MADHAAASASKTPEASKSAERGSADRQPHAFAASPAEPTPADAASPELAQVVLAQAAELGRQAGFQANASHLELAYRVHRLLVAAREGELAIPHGVDRGAVRRFVDDVFFTTQFLDEDIHSEGKARASRPLDRSNVTQGLPATGVVGDSETTDRESDVCRPNSGAGGAETPNSESGIDTDAEARRIAAELVRLHEAGVIKSEEDASFYANLVHRFGASFTACVGPHVPKQGAPNGFTVPEPGNTHADSRLAVGRSFNRV